MSRAKLSENQHRITAKIIQMCLPSSKIWNLLLISEKPAKFLSEAQVHFVSVVSLGLIGLAGSIWFGQCVRSNTIQRVSKCSLLVFLCETKILSSEYFELNHNQDTFRSRSIIIKVDHCQSSIPQPLIGLNRSQLAVRWRGPTANCATRNFQLFSSRGQPIPHKHHSSKITGVKTKVWLAFSEPSTWPGCNMVTSSHRENQLYQKEKRWRIFS